MVPELVYSPHLSAKDTQAAEAGEPPSGSRTSKRWRIDLVLFVNGLPVATLELKSEFQQSVHKAIRQYKQDRRPKDTRSGKPEPLLTFKRGALVHFAVSQFEAHMTTRLDGDATTFLPFNQGTRDGGEGNDVPEDPTTYATSYLWKQVLQPANLLRILGRFVHLEIQEDEAWDGRKRKKETLIFPRYHQWDLVTRLIEATRQEGSGHKYLVQHSAGSGKSNSIAWTAHQLASLHFDDPERQGERIFHSVIVVTDRTVLDAQLQETIYQFEHKDGVVGRITREEGQGSKSEKLAAALQGGQRIIIVTLQTFPWVLRAIEDSISLKQRRFAIIADEAHSSQSGRTARELRAVLAQEGQDAGDTVSAETVSAEELLVASVEQRRASPNLSYYAFTATPKSKTLELFGRRPNPAEPPSKHNKPEAFHVYSMRQAIEEGYILDVLKNYTSYEVARRLALEASSDDIEVDSKRARIKLGQWVELHETNIAQKVKVVVENFRDKVQPRLGGRAKAMIVTSSRKQAVLFGLAFADYVQKKGYDLQAMVAFSGDIELSGEETRVAPELVGSELGRRVYNETTMNPGLKGRDMRQAFDTPEYQVMIVAEKFQTGFDQPKLCAMYVNKKLAGLDCVQTLSRLNRRYPNKTTSVLDFVNEPDDILAAFQAYYQTASLLDVSDPNLIWDLFEKLKAADIFRWSEVCYFVEVFFQEGADTKRLRNVCEPTVKRWKDRLRQAKAEFEKRRALMARAETTGDAVLFANAESEFKEAKKALEAVNLFKSDLTSFARTYEFLAQIVDYDSPDLEQLSLFASVVAPLLRDEDPDEPIDLSSVELRDFRLAKKREQDLKLQADADTGLIPTTAVGTGKARGEEEEWLSQIIRRLNELFGGDLSAGDGLNYLRTVSDKVGENETVVQQVRNNPRDKALLGDFPDAVTDAVIECGEVHQRQMHTYLNSAEVQREFRDLAFDFLLAQLAERGLGNAQA